MCHLSRDASAFLKETQFAGTCLVVRNSMANCVVSEPKKPGYDEDDA